VTPLPIEPIQWVFDPPPPSASRSGGTGTWHVFSPDVETFVREILQNANDQKRDDCDAVHVRFRFHAISGAQLETFLEGLSWDTLEPHLQGAASADYVTISPRIRATLDALEQGKELIILAIEDVGTEGLTGGEDDEDGNFALLCRHELVTAEGRNQRGGSFGLGKSVLWRFSSLSTVLFSSSLAAEGAIRDRFFGRVLLPFHETGAGGEVEGWSGSGWIGSPEPHGYGQRAVSIWDDAARGNAASCLIARPAGQRGATLLIVGFAEPSVEQGRDLNEVCADVVAAAGKWFWPAMAADRLKITVEAHRQGERIFRQVAEPGADVRPFILAETHDGAFVDKASVPGEVAETSIPLDVPAKRVGPGQPPVVGVAGTTRLRLRLAQTQERDLGFHVALQRGTGMIVRYLAIPTGVSDDASFHAVLSAGTALEDTADNRAVEKFLRAAEPPEHKEWTAKTDRMAAAYQAGAGTALDRLQNGVRDAVREMTEHTDDSGDELPDQVRRLFPISPEGDGPPPPPSSRLEDAEATLENGEWRFSGTYRTRASNREWAFRVRLILDEETGRGERATITRLEVGNAEGQGPDADGSWLIKAPAGSTEVAFEGRAPAASALPGEASRRTRVRLATQLERES